MPHRRGQPLIALLVEATGGWGRDLIRGVMDYARQHGPWRFFVEPRNLPAYRLPAGTRYDGLIIMPSCPAHVRFVRAFAGPRVNVSTLLPCPGVPSVLLDDAAVGRMAADHFLDRGFRALAFHAAVASHAHRQRQRGFLDRAAHAGCRTDAFLDHQPQAMVLDHPAYHQRLLRWLARLPDPVAVFAATDYEARIVVQACGELGRAIPDHVAVLGADNDGLICEMSDLPLSSINCGTRRHGFEAARLLDRLMRGAPQPAQPLLVPPLDVVTRRSTDALAISDPIVAQALQVIRERACQPLRVGDLLEAVPASRRWLERRFQALLGRSPHQEIERVRVEAARRMLAEPASKVARIARACGYRHLASFTRAFRQVTGQTPAAYRRDAVARPPDAPLRSR